MQSGECTHICSCMVTLCTILLNTNYTISTKNQHPGLVLDIGPSMGRNVLPILVQTCQNQAIPRCNLTTLASSQRKEKELYTGGGHALFSHSFDHGLGACRQKQTEKKEGKQGKSSLPSLWSNLLDARNLAHLVSYHSPFSQPLIWPKN